MTDEQRLQMITEQLIIVRDNLFRGMSKSIQKLQAKSINEVLELPNYTESPSREWVGLTDKDIDSMVEVTDLSGAYYYDDLYAVVRAAEAKLKEKNT